MRRIRIDLYSGVTVRVELDHRATIAVTGRTRNTDGEIVGGRSGVTVDARDVARITLEDETPKETA